MRDNASLAVVLLCLTSTASSFSLQSQKIIRSVVSDVDFSPLNTIEYSEASTSSSWSNNHRMIMGFVGMVMMISSVVLVVKDYLQRGRIIAEKKPLIVALAAEGKTKDPAEYDPETGEYLYEGEEIFYEGKAAKATLVSNAALSLTGILIPAALIGFVRYAVSNYKITNKRVVVKTGFSEENQVAYTELEKIETIPRLFGACGDCYCIPKKARLLSCTPVLITWKPKLLLRNVLMKHRQDYRPKKKNTKSK